VHLKDKVTIAQLKTILDI